MGFCGGRGEHAIDWEFVAVFRNLGWGGFVERDMGRWYRGGGNQVVGWGGGREFLWGFFYLVFHYGERGGGALGKCYV